jgi:outer membrane immunogenic protein
MGCAVLFRRVAPVLGFVLGVNACAAAASADEAHWRGVYAGAQLGSAWSRADWDYTNANYFNSSGGAVLGDGFSQNPKGMIGGAFGGYNYMAGPWLMGLEISVSASNLNQERASTVFPATDTTTTKLDWLTTATGRVGYAFDRWLVYGKGGWAAAEVSLSLQNAGGGVYASDDQWGSGWVAGGGVEYMICPWASLGVGYEYADLSIDNKAIGCPNCGGGPGGGTPVVDGDVNVQSVMARLSFHP